MSIITLTTDWNSEDYYIGAFKGKILSLINNAVIVDITHKVIPFNTYHAAFVLRNSYFHFPGGTIHIILVNTEPSEKYPFLIVKAKGHYFIGADNGVFDLIINDSPELIIKLNISEYTNLKSYSAFDIFADAVFAVSQDNDISRLGTPIEMYNQRTPLRATIEGKSITGNVIYIDSYMNAITNITTELFERVRQGRLFEIYVQSKHYKITIINDFYHQSPVGELLAIFNSAGLLEIAINNGSAARLLNLELNSTVRIVFL